MCPVRGEHLFSAFELWWHPFAACRRLGGRDDVWFVVPAHVRARSTLPQVEAALKVCEACPVRVACWYQASVDPHAVGVWGGEYWTHTPKLRRAMVARGPLPFARLDRAHMR